MIAFFTAAFAAAMLSACAMSDDRLSSFLVAPGNYVLYGCEDIARTTASVLTRQKELEGLMAKAGTGAGARMIADATYGTDYATTRGQLRSLRAAAAEKNCNPPGAGSPVDRPSDRAIH